MSACECVCVCLPILLRGTRRKNHKGTGTHAHIHTRVHRRNSEVHRGRKGKTHDSGEGATRVAASLSSTVGGIHSTGTLGTDRSSAWARARESGGQVVERLVYVLTQTMHGRGSHEGKHPDAPYTMSSMDGRIVRDSGQLMSVGAVSSATRK